MTEFYLINLERSADRLKHFYKQMKLHNLPRDRFHLFKAIDAKTHEFTESELVLTQHLRAKNELKTVICNFLSHYYVWCDIRKKGYKHALVLQDDVQFANGFWDALQNVINEIPKDAEIVNLGLHAHAAGARFIDFPIHDEYDTSKYILENVTNSICRYRDDINPCSLAYIVTPNAYHENGLFNTFPTIARAIDRFFNDYCQTRNIFYGSVRVLSTGTAAFKSTVFDGPSQDELLASYLSHVNNTSFF